MSDFSALEKDRIREALPAFYVSKEGRICTHRFNDDDAPVYCKTRDDAEFIMTRLMAARLAEI